MTPETVAKKEFTRQPQQAEIYVVCGPMFSGKSTELIQIVSRLPHAKYTVQSFAPDIDSRRGSNSINSQNGLQTNAKSIKSSVQMLDLVLPETEVVVIDEAQFFDRDLPDVCEILAKSGRRVIVAGLDKDFRGEPFGPMGKMKEIADKVNMLHAYCACCGRRATRTQRMIIDLEGNRRPANYSDPTVLIGATESYEVRCRDHHEVPGKPEPIFEEKSENLKPREVWISGKSKTATEVARVLKKLGHKVFLPNYSKRTNPHTDWDKRFDRKVYDIAIYTEGGDGNIQELVEWRKMNKPSLFLRRGKIDLEKWPSSVKLLCSRVVCFDKYQELEDIIKDYLSEVRLESK